MFDNKKEPQDMFDGVDAPANLPIDPGGAPTPVPPAAVQAPRPASPVAAPTATPKAAPAPERRIVSDRHVGTGGHLWKTILIVFVAFAAMSLAALMAYKFMTPDRGSMGDDSAPTGQTEGENDENDLPDGKGGEGDETPVVPAQEIVLDTDGDGLTNQEEQTAGTDPAKPDTDSDLLGDKEEVQVYGTNPLRADTDGDTFTDGQEVRSGYNPNGEGKFLEIPAAN